MRNFIEILSQASMASEVDSTHEVKGALNFCGRTAKSACSVGKFARNPPKYLRERSEKKASRREVNISALSINKKDITQEIMTSLVSNTSEVEKPFVNEVLKAVLDEQEQLSGVEGSSSARGNVSRDTLNVENCTGRRTEIKESTVREVSSFARGQGKCLILIILLR